MAIVEHTETGVVVKLENGPEVFTAADPLEATNQLAKSLDEGKKWGRQGWDKAAQYEAELATLKQQNKPPSAEVPPGQNYTPEQWIELGKNIDSARAAARGMTREQLLELENRIVSTTAEQATQMAIINFRTMHPEYNDADTKAQEILGSIFAEKGWEKEPLTGERLHLAHLEAEYRQKQNPNYGYKTLTMDEINSTANEASKARQTPPPMLPGNSPDVNAVQDNPYAMDMNALRSQAIKQQLEQK